ncbi:hypothetical protein [Paenibacillus naphthalenovorans]|uniref:hypothetical protein n=1 Tax=Paenibacillus naphthalenovorans TaxID=162209 RepID=UPI00088B2444|nr:hypothetical protein [Paenibacillus naphthalenovorans]SDJ52755.1 hypothetical protein SAMN05421868_13051 [Paenibacillus naphthalenovorans]
MNVTTMNGIAVVTAGGIRFLDKSYTCPLAIQERWFEKAHLKGFRFVPIYYLSNELSQIYFLHDDEIVTCYEIHRGQPSFQKLEKYFSSIQRLKRQRARIIKPNVANKEN